MRIRASLGTIVHLEIKKIKMDIPLKTGYFLVGDGCRRGCDFCAQSYRAKGSADKLSRIIWPWIELRSLNEHSHKLLELDRICFQCLDYPGLLRDLIGVIDYFRNDLGYYGPLSASVNPFSAKGLLELKRAGLDNVSISLDVPTRELYKKIKIEGVMSADPQRDGPDACHEEKTFDLALATLEDSVLVFGDGKVTTHLIVGLGENDMEMIERMHWLINRKIKVGLFAFTPLAGTPMQDRPPPSVGRYRAIQLSYYLLAASRLDMNIFKFGISEKLVGYNLENLPEDIRGEIFEKDIFRGGCFRTSGCPECSRPYYNERPGQTPFNYPRALSPEEIEDARTAIREYLANVPNAQK